MYDDLTCSLTGLSSEIVRETTDSSTYLVMLIMHFPDCPSLRGPPLPSHSGHFGHSSALAARLLEMDHDAVPVDVLECGQCEIKDQGARIKDQLRVKF